MFGFLTVLAAATFSCSSSKSYDSSKTLDTDGDGLSDYQEHYLYKTDPNLKDTDGDGISDYDELRVYRTDPLSHDTDADGVDDSVEIFVKHTNPNKQDTDSDGVPDLADSCPTIKGLPPTGCP